MTRFFAAAVFAIACAPRVLAQASSDSSNIVYGENWAFAVKEPVGWRLDYKIAEQWGANAALYRDMEDLKQGSGLIRITVASKVNEDTERDLKSDMEAYSEQHPHVTFRDFPVSHRSYHVFSQLFEMRGQSYEYVTYLNPGASFRHLLSVALNKQGSPASEQELAAYREVVASLVMVR